MQIVIKITKKLYDRYKEKDHIKRCDIDEFEKALDRCVILPEGHGRLIDTEEVDRSLSAHVTLSNNPKEDWKHIYEAIEAVLTIIESEG